MLLRETDLMEQRLVAMMTSSNINEDVESRLTQVIDRLSIFQTSVGHQVFRAYWRFFFDLANKFRGIHIVEDTSGLKPFKESVSYITYGRSWLENAGMWGAPGTPPPGEDEALPVNSFTVPVVESLLQKNVFYPNDRIPDYPRSTVFVPRRNMSRCLHPIYRKYVDIPEFDEFEVVTVEVEVDASMEESHKNQTVRLRATVKSPTAFMEHDRWFHASIWLLLGLLVGAFSTKVLVERTSSPLH
jgi:hypothetical protein